MKSLPTAYPGPEPSSSAARVLTRCTVASGPSRNIGTGASWNTARSSRRSVSSASGPGPAAWDSPGTGPARIAPSTSTAVSSSANAAWSTVLASAPGSAAACRSPA